MNRAAEPRHGTENYGLSKLWAEARIAKKKKVCDR